MLSVISHHVTIGFCLPVVFKSLAMVLLRHWKHDSHLMMCSHYIIKIYAGSVVMKLTLSLLMSCVYIYIYIYIYMELLVKPEMLMSCIYIYIYMCVWTYVWQRRKPPLSICCTMFQHWINAKWLSVSQLCVDTLPASKVTLISHECISVIGLESVLRS